MKNKIAAAYPGTQLAFTEYNYGAGHDISGGIAQADVLGIFGREGVFAASQWPLYNNEAFVGGAFMMYRNFDGHKGAFGDTSVDAVTGNVPDTSIYASLNSTNPGRMVLVAINKTANVITADISLSHAPAFNQAAIYQLTAASALPVAAGTMALSNSAHFSYNMPPYSVSTLHLTSRSPSLTATHDFNGDGKSDILLRNSSTGAAVGWLMNGGTVTQSATIGTVASAWQIVAQRDFNGDGKADLLWRNTSTGALVAVADERSQRHAIDIARHRRHQLGRRRHVGFQQRRQGRHSLAQQQHRSRGDLADERRHGDCNPESSAPWRAPGSSRAPTPKVTLSGATAAAARW